MVTIDYIKANQEESKHISIMKDIFEYIDELISENDYQTIDDFIREFCNNEICFQYYVCLLTASLLRKDKLQNIGTLKQKAISAGMKEIGIEDTIKTLNGLI
jgi:NADPH-dependent glutamate synthase beta subunit-like oxidoreductase